MKAQALVKLLREHEAGIRERGVTALSLFGSTARGDAGPESDVDILVDIDPDRRFSLIDLVKLKDYLSGLIGKEADITQRSAIRRPRMRRSISRDEVRVFR